MRKLIQIMILLLSCISFGVQAADNYLHTDKVLSFGNTEYSLGWSSHPQDFQYLQEYFPKGQTPEAFTDMFSVWLFVGDFPEDQWIQNMANSYTERQKKDKLCRFEVYFNEGEHMFECLLGESSDDKMTKVGINIYRCKNIEVDGKSALLICFYSGQAEGDAIMNFLRDLKEKCPQLIQAMIKFELPKVSLK